MLCWPFKVNLFVLGHKTHNMIIFLWSMAGSRGVQLLKPVLQPPVHRYCSILSHNVPGLSMAVFTQCLSELTTFCSTSSMYTVLHHWETSVTSWRWPDTGQTNTVVVSTLTLWWYECFIYRIRTYIEGSLLPQFKQFDSQTFSAVSPCCNENCLWTVPFNRHTGSSY